MEKKKSIWEILRIVIVVALLAVVLYEAVMIFFDQREYAVAGNEYEKITEQYVKTTGESVTEADTSADSEGEEAEDTGEFIPYPDLDIDYAKLKEINPDFIGWLYFPAVDISYPVVRENEINEYLYKTFEGTNNRSGSIFMDVLSNREFKGFSDMLFGHNMKNGTMFGSMKKLYQTKDEDLLLDDPHIYIYNEDGVRIYRVFAYYTTTEGSYSYTEVTNEDEYDDYISYIRRNTSYSIPNDMNFDNYSPLLTLSTCSGQSGSGKRFVVHSVFMKKE